MSYLEFHLLFTLPPIVLMALSLPQSLAEVGGRRAQWALPLISFIAFLYTIPWDNYLVAKEVWWYGPERVLATIGVVPIEEYLFFILQPLLTGLFLFQYLGRWRGPVKSATARSAWGGFLLFLTLTLLGIGFLASHWDPGLYMGLILTWSCPLVAGMWLYGGDVLWSHRSSLFFGVGIPSLYLWIADALAIASGIWTISSEFTLGMAPFGLPIEEATFFLMTNLLVVKGILLLLYGDHDGLTPAPSTTKT